MYMRISIWSVMILIIYQMMQYPIHKEVKIMAMIMAELADNLNPQTCKNPWE